jgi:hypothetical protein
MTPGKPLESARAKLHRANDHLTRLSDEIHVDAAAKRYGASLCHDSQTDEWVITGLMPRDLFTHYAVVAGEVVGQARSARKHAIWEMVPRPVLGRTGFPVEL